MANEKHLAILKQGVEVWNKWREKNPKIEPNLSRENLSHANFSGINLSHARLLETDLIDTDLINADLSGANLSEADLSNADLSGANLTKAHLAETYFEKTNLSGANLSNAYFYRVYIFETDFSGANLNGADISGENLNKTDFRRANFNGAQLFGTILNNADFSSANFSSAELIATQALATNFQGATFTGACLEDWHINSETNLEGVICDYVYLKKNRQERRPHDSNKNFAPGEFTKLFQKALETVDLIFSNGIEWAAFSESFQQLKAEIDSDELSIQAIEKKSGGAFVIRVEVPSEANKAEIEKYIKQKYETRLKVIEDKYQRQLQAKDEEIKAKNEKIIEAYREKSTDLLEMARIMAIAQKPPINIEATGNKSVSEAPKYDMRGSNFQGGFAEMNYGKMVETQYNYPSEQKQTLAEAATEIQRLLKQLEETNPTATETEQQAYVTASIPPTLKTRFVSALQAGWKEAIKEFFDNPYVNIGVAILEGWQEAE